MKVSDFIFSCLLNELAFTGLSNKLVEPNNLITGKVKYGENGSAQPVLSKELVFRFVDLINSGLKDLYTKFCILRKTVLICLKDYITTYTLDEKFTCSRGSPNEVHYIYDTKEDPFINDVVKILTLYSDNQKIGMNSVACSNTVMVNSFNSVFIHYPIEGDFVIITYQALPKLLNNLDLTKEVKEDSIFTVLDQEIVFPHNILNIIRSYVCGFYLMYNPVLSNPQKAQEYLSLYDNKIQEFKALSAKNNSTLWSNNLLEEKGFV